jgi:hypothetical protein
MDPRLPMREGLLLAVLATCVPITLGASAAIAQELPLPSQLEESLAWRADPEAALRRFRVRPVRGPAPHRELATVQRKPGDASDGAERMCRKKSTAEDVAIANDPSVLEIRPSLVTSPRRQDVVVMAYAGSGFSSAPGLRCFVSASFDRGQRWSESLRLPMISPTSECGAPALAYSPDGKYLYAAYQDQRSTTTFLTEDGSIVRSESDTDIVVTRSSDEGRTWTKPVLGLDGAAGSMTYRCTPAYPNGCVAIDWTAGSSFERPSLAAGADGCAESSVYVAATQFPENDLAAPPTTIVVARSLNRGTTWGSPRALDAGQAGSPAVITQGPRVATGPRGEVLVAWYHSGIDGPRFGVFEIRVRRSGNGGATWDPIVAAAAGELETAFSLGSRPYKRWWTTMFPAVVIDRDGRAHVVYTQDPEPLADTAEEGDIRYVSSPCPPYTSWSLPADVNDDGLGRAQGFASLATRRHGHTTIVEAVWEDTRLAPDSVPGLTASQARLFLYDVFHARLTPALGPEWSANRRVSDVSSVQNAANTNDRTALTSNDSGLVFAVWSDRRSKTGPTDRGDDLVGSRIAP